jgi:Transcription factor S-II (TFIIS), central domain
MNTLATSESSMVDPKELAERIEAEIFTANHESTDNTYRSSARSHFLNLKVNKSRRSVLMIG